MLDTSNDDAAMIVMLSRQMSRRVSLGGGAGEDKASNEQPSLTEAQKTMPKFREQDVKMGRRLGSGAFCSVYAVSRQTNGANNGNLNASNKSLQSTMSSFGGSSSHSLELNDYSGDFSALSVGTSDDQSVPLPASPVKSVMDTSTELYPAGGSVVSPTPSTGDSPKAVTMLRGPRQRRFVKSNRAGSEDDDAAVQAGLKCFEEDRLQALKTLRKNTKKSPEKLALAYQDLRNEVLILSSLASETSYHPNIIRFWGISDTFWTSPESAFMVQEKLVESLDKSIERWIHDGGASVGGGGGGGLDGSNHSGGSLRSGRSLTAVTSNVLSSAVTMGRPKKHLRAGAQAERIEQVALPVAGALEFLHAQSILYRDLKPSNLGFDKNGTVKLFDFGLAVRIPATSTSTMTGNTSTADASSDDGFSTDEEGPSRPRRASRRRKTKSSKKKAASGSFQLPGRVGTYRYMAPEVARSEFYSFPADVYSFGLLLFEICALEKPHAKAQSIEQLQRIAEQDDVQPSLSPIQSKPMKLLLASCWHSDQSARPTFKGIKRLLEKEVDHHATTP